MLVGAADGASNDTHRPIEQAGVVGAALQLPEDAFPDAVAAPRREAVVHGLPGAKPHRQIAPGGTGAEDPAHAIEQGAVVAAGAAPPATTWGRQQTPQLLPLSIGHITTVQ